MINRLQPRNRCQQPGAENWSVEFRTIGDVKSPIAIFVNGPSILGHVDRHLGQYDVLNGLKFAGRSQPKSPDIVIVDFMFDDFIHAGRRERLTQLSLVTGLPTVSRLLSRWLFPLGPGDVA